MSYIKLTDYVDWINVPSHTSKLRNKPYKELFEKWADLHDVELTNEILNTEDEDSSYVYLDSRFNRRMFKFWEDHYNILNAVKGIDGFSKHIDSDFTHGGSNTTTNSSTSNASNSSTDTSNSHVTGTDGVVDTHYQEAYNTEVLGDDTSATDRDKRDTTINETSTDSATRSGTSQSTNSGSSTTQYGKTLNNDTDITDTEKTLNMLFMKEKGHTLYETLDEYLMPMLLLVY